MTSSILPPRPPYMCSRTVRMVLTSMFDQSRVSCEMALTFYSELAVAKILRPSHFTGGCSGS